MMLDEIYYKHKYKTNKQILATYKAFCNFKKQKVEELQENL